jgi:hypothetical protein
MPEINITFFIKKYIDYILTLIISGILFWVVNFFGLGYTFDSRMYVEISQEINSISFFLVQGFKIKPPALPLLIAMIGESNMLWFNFLCFLIIQFFGVYWSHKINHSILRITFLSILIFATPHLLINSFLWTEPLFLSIMLFTFYLLDKYYYTSHSGYVLSAFVLLIILPFVRFAGLFLVVPIFGFLLFLSKSKKAVLTSILVLLLISSVWVILFKDGFTGRWERFIGPLISGRLSHIEYNLSSYSKALSSWFFPYVIEGVFTRFTSLLIVLTVIYKSTKMYFRQQNNIIYLTPLLFLIYCFIMITVFRVEYYAAERYLAIFYLLFILNLFFQIDQFIKSVQSIIVKQIFYCSIVLLASYSILRTIKNVYFWHEVRAESINLLFY